MPMVDGKMISREEYGVLFRDKQRRRRKAYAEAPVSKKSCYYAYVHEDDGKLFGLPIKMTKEEAAEYELATREFMKMRGFFMQRVNPLHSNDEKIDEMFHQLYDPSVGRRQEAEPDPNLKYLDIYPVNTHHGKVMRHRPS